MPIAKRQALVVPADVVTFDASWTILFDPETATLATLVKDNSLYLGDDDAFPAASLSTFTGAFANGSADAKKILITTMASASLAGIQSHWKIDDAWMRALKEHSQGYLVSCGTAVSGCDELLVLGGSAKGAQRAART
jgi:hypothetical protein